MAGGTNSAGQVIHAGQFTVDNVEYDEQGTAPGGAAVSVTKIHLQEVSSKKSFRMNCALPLTAQCVQFVTPAEIQGVVGGYMNLKVAP